MIKRFTIGLIFIYLFPILTHSQSANDSLPPFYQAKTDWVDSLMQHLSQDEKIGQLFMAAAYSNRGSEHEAAILRLINDYKIGGLIFFQGGPVRQAMLTNKYQEAAEIPLLIAMDAEWGIGMRLDSTMNFPYQMTLGAIQDENLIYRMGQEIAQDIQRVGMQINFAPVVDVNNNPANPVINYRSFGENKYNVAGKSTSYMKGMQDQRVLATAKHFPGHGDTDVDSHYGLPVIKHSVERLNDLELYPFRQIFREGIGGVMIAHLNIPALDSTENLASTLSRPIVNDLLKQQLGFEGLIFSDAMNMKAVSGHYDPGMADVKAIIAGNDIIEFSENIPKAIEQVKIALDEGTLSQKELDQKVRKILLTKVWTGLTKKKFVKTENLVDDLNRTSANLLYHQLAEAALTVLENKGQIIPVKQLDSLKIASVSIGSETKSPFQNALDLYAQLEHFHLPAEASSTAINNLKQNLKKYDLLIIGLHDIYRRPINRMGYNQGVVEMVNQLAQQEHVIFSHFRNPYLIDQMKGLAQASGLIVAYQDDPVFEEAAAQLIFGGIGASGKLPVSIGNLYKFGDGLNLTETIRLKYTLPEEAHLDSKYIRQKTDSLINLAITEQAFPGCQLLVAKDQKVIWHKAYGYHTYDSITPVSLNDLYDYASLTKITSALPALMKLHGQGRFKLDGQLGRYLPYFKRSNKRTLDFRHILAHQAGLVPYINYWQNTLRKNGSFKWFTFKTDSSRRFPVKITDNLYLHRKYTKKIYRAIKKSPVNEQPEYLYSGLVFILFPHIVECMVEQDFEKYLKQTFYKPLGANTITYNPTKHFSRARIVPTEFDSLFRKQLVRGSVHDEAAAMMGGVSANAGLFSNANDLAKLMSMYLNFGQYGGHRFIDSASVAEFSQCQFCDLGNRRGLGFDKPMLEHPEDGYVAPSASPDSFGHSGFTGTYAWADPKNDLLFVLMSNRVYPSRSHSKLYSLNIRPQLHQIFYDATINSPSRQKNENMSANH